MKYFSLFSGIGGLDYGLQNIGELVGYSEINKNSIKIFEKHFKSKNYGDITKIEFKKLPNFDMLIGGFPCQSFSIINMKDKIKGFENKKGQMIFYIYELLQEKKPQFFVLENVKGLLSHNKGKTFIDIIKLLKNAGYFTKVLLLNSINYGSAQNRERLIFLGNLNNFNEKNIKIIDNTKRFKDIKDNNGPYKYLKLTERTIKKLQGKTKIKFELIGGYDIVGTLVAQFGCGEKLIQENEKWRFLTIKECERLQGFPDDWTNGICDTYRYEALGNAVNCQMSKYIFQDYLKGLWY